MRFPTKQCLNGYNGACNRSKEMKTWLPSEAIEQVSVIIKYKAPKPCFDIFFCFKKPKGSRSCGGSNRQISYSQVHNDQVRIASE